MARPEGALEIHDRLPRLREVVSADEFQTYIAAEAL